LGAHSVIVGETDKITETLNSQSRSLNDY